MTGVLIETDELAELIETEPGLVIVDVRWRLGGPPGEPEFEAGHLPGAQYVDLEAELSAVHTAAQDASGGRIAQPGGRHPMPDHDVFQSAMRRIGVSLNSPVVIYDDANALASARLWWLLTDAGHGDVRVLDGGLAAWREEGLPLETGPAASAAGGNFVARPGQRTRVDAETVAGRLGRDDTPRLADVRAYERFTGATEPMDPVGGHIPGAVSVPSMANLDERGRFRPADEIRARYRELDSGGDPVFYCGSGITAAHTLLARESAGLTGGQIYPGSWSDWVSDPSRPVATGDGPQL